MEDIVNHIFGLVFYTELLLLLLFLVIYFTVAFLFSASYLDWIINIVLFIIILRH